MTIMFPSQVLFLVHFASELINNIPLADRERKGSLMCAWMPLCVPLCEDTCVCVHMRVCTLGSDLKSFPKHVLWCLPKGASSQPLAYLSPFTLWLSRNVTVLSFLLVL